MTKVWSPGFNVQLVFLLWANGSTSSGNFVQLCPPLTSMAAKIGDNIVTIQARKLPMATPQF